MGNARCSVQHYHVRPIRTLHGFLSSKTHCGNGKYLGDVKVEEDRIELSERKLVWEGEIDPTIKVENIFLGYHTADEELFKKAAMEINVNGNVLVSDLERLMMWINKNSMVTDVKECSKWRITLERLS